MLKLGRVLQMVADGKISDARTRLEVLLKHHPDCAAVSNMLAVVLIYDCQLEGAVRCLEDIVFGKDGVPNTALRIARTNLIICYELRREDRLSQMTRLEKRFEELPLLV